MLTEADILQTAAVQENTSIVAEPQPEPPQALPEPPKEKVYRTFEEKDAKSWGDIDLGSVLVKTNKKQKVAQAKPTTFVITKSPKVREDIRLKLTHDLDFSITQIEKLNKGFTNVSRVNCFMNVCLQSLFACPGFFNMIQTLSQSDLSLDPTGTVMKLINVQKHLDAKY